MAYIDIKKALPRRILVNFSDLLKLQNSFDNFYDGEQTRTFDTGEEEYPLSCINVIGLEDHVIWARLNGRQVVCPLIERESLPQGDVFKTSKITVTFRKKGSYVTVWAAYYGELTPRFPDSLHHEDERIEAIRFWREHALIVRRKDSYEESEKPDWANGNPQLSMHGAESFRTVFSLVNNRNMYFQQELFRVIIVL